MAAEPGAGAKTTRRDFALGVAALAALPAAAADRAAAAVGGAARRRASDVAKALHSAQPTPALSLAVATSKGLVWADAFGKANLDFDVAATPAHRFKLGSVSKALTATAAARMTVRGKLDLDAPISNWLPELPAQHRDTTMRQLLTHRGGIRHYNARDLDPKAAGGIIDQHNYPDRKDILAVFINDPLVAPVGTRVSYSTFGFTLASLVMEAAAAQPFKELMQAEIADAFELPSLVVDDPFTVTPMRASGYNKGSDTGDAYPRQLAQGWGISRHSNPSYSWAGAGFLMTPSDTARFGAALLDTPRSPVSAAERALLFTPQTERSGNTPPLGLAWRLDTDTKGRRRWHHAGASVGGRASLVIYPDQGLSIAFATNVMTLPNDVLQPSSDLADAFV